MSGFTAEELQLVEPALSAAKALKRNFPEIEFTSGRRTRAQQAGAMASNVILNRIWIGQTYMVNDVSCACQAWVDSHKDTSTLKGIAEGLAGVLARFDDKDVAQLSRHLNGRAFDVRPIPGDHGERIKKFIRGLPGLQKFLEREGGLTRWHAQF